jgi:hypothetical protein
MPWRKEELQCPVTKKGGGSLLGRWHFGGVGCYGRRKEHHCLHAHVPLGLLLLLPLWKKGGAKSRLHARKRERERELLLLQNWESDRWERERAPWEKREAQTCAAALHVWEKSKREKDEPMCV